MPSRDNRVSRCCTVSAVPEHSVFPETTLRTERLVLRPFAAADIADVRAGAADELTQRWFPLPRPYTLAHAAEYVMQTAPRFRETGGGIHLAIADPATERLLGNISLKRTNWRALTTEVGYWIAPWARGRGCAAEATRALAEWALADRGFERLELLAATGNIASQKVAARSGFRREGILRNAGLTHHGRVDLLLFSLIPADLPSRA